MSAHGLHSASRVGTVPCLFAVRLHTCSIPGNSLIAGSTASQALRCSSAVSTIKTLCSYSYATLMVAAVQGLCLEMLSAIGRGRMDQECD